VYRLIRSVTLVKSIGSAKPGKAQVINFKARVKPKARALEKAGLFSITITRIFFDIQFMESPAIRDFSVCQKRLLYKFFQTFLKVLTLRFGPLDLQYLSLGDLAISFAIKVNIDSFPKVVH
jgi:hypothetical protein